MRDLSEKKRKEKILIYRRYRIRSPDSHQHGSVYGTDTV